MIEKINNILLVEDEQGHAELIRRSFKSASVPVSLTVARNLHEARSSIAKSTPDLIIADFRLPDGKGIELIPDKKKDSPYPVIILTSYGDELVAVEAMKAGAFDYIVKSEVTMDNMPRLYKRIMREWSHVTERKKAEEESRSSKLLLEAFVENSPSIIFIKDLDGRLIHINHAFEDLFGIGREDLLGKTDYDLYPTSKITAERMMANDRMVLEAGKPLAIEEVPKVNGEDRSYITVKFPIRDEQGEITSIAGIATDITERKKAEEELKKSKKFLVKAQAIAHIGSWEWDVVKNESFCSDELYRIHGLLPQQYNITFERFIEHVHPDDRKFVEKSVNAALYEGISYNIEFRIIHPNGLERIIRSEAEVVYSKNGKPLKMIGIEQDITERKKAEEALEKSEQHYHSIFDNAMDGIGLCTPEGKLVTPNNAFAEITGYSIEELLGMSYKELTPPEYHEMEAEKMKILLESGIPQEYEKEYIRKDGTRIPLLFNVSAICDVNGKPVLFLAILKNMTNIKKAEKMLLEQKEILEQKNIALNEILGQIEIEKKQIKDNVIANAEHLLLPVVQKLRLTGESLELVKLLQKNLQELTSSFGTKLSKEGVKLTTREIEFCNMIKNGLANKEIASLSNVSLATIERHRANIRKKLGLINKDVNLSSFLKTF